MIRHRELTKIQESICSVSVENITPVKDYTVTPFITMLCKMLFFFCILRGSMLAFVVLVPWKGKQQEYVSYHLMSKVILETVNVNIFSKSFDRENKTV